MSRTRRPSQSECVSVDARLTSLPIPAATPASRPVADVLADAAMLPSCTSNPAGCSMPSGGGSVGARRRASASTHAFLTADPSANFCRTAASMIAKPPDPSAAATPRSHRRTNALTSLPPVAPTASAAASNAARASPMNAAASAASRIAAATSGATSHDAGVAKARRSGGTVRSAAWFWDNLALSTAADARYARAATRARAPTPKCVALAPTLDARPGSAKLRPMASSARSDTRDAS